MRSKIKKLISTSKLKKFSRRKNTDDSNTPRITNETVAAHREEVLSGARKYIYPLKHSKHRIVVVSTILFISSIVAFFTYCMLSLYKFQSSSTFIYRVTQVVPFPVARSGSTLMAYENYLFELRRYTHYYVTQQKLDLNSTSGQQQLTDFKKRALAKVVNDAFTKKLAAQNKVSVTDQEVNDSITILRHQNRLGNSDKAFEDVLREYWGWSVKDFKRSLKQQLLAQKLVSRLDTDTHTRAETALAQLKQGKDFAELAKEISEDPSTKPNGGDFGILIDKNNRDVSPQTADALFKLKPGQISDVISIGYALEIDKLTDVSGEKLHAAHIIFNFKDISFYVNDLKDKQPSHYYIKI